MTSGKARKHNGSRKRHRRRKSGLNRRQRRILGLGLLVLTAVMLVLFAAFRAVSHEGTSRFAVSTAEIRKNGRVKITSVESFDQSYYSEEELADEIRQSVASYNQQNGSHIREGIFNVTDGVAKLELTYDSCEDYVRFNERSMFLGPVSDALAQGYDFSTAYTAVNRDDMSKILTKDNLSEQSGNLCLIVTEPLNIITQRQILYAGTNLRAASDTEADVTGEVSEDQPAIIIFR